MQPPALRGGFSSLVSTQTIEATHINKIIQGVGQVKTGLPILGLHFVKVHVLLFSLVRTTCFYYNRMIHAQKGALGDSTIICHVAPSAPSSFWKKCWVFIPAFNNRSSGRPRTSTMHFICWSKYMHILKGECGCVNVSGLVVVPFGSHSWQRKGDQPGRGKPGCSRLPTHQWPQWRGGREKSLALWGDGDKGQDTTFLVFDVGMYRCSLWESRLIR